MLEILLLCEDNKYIASCNNPIMNPGKSTFFPLGGFELPKQDALFYEFSGINEFFKQY